ncbi:MAG: hypothetical protein JW790_01835 [Dehalococcoidales bacterium]|nr:hypothetical protein [Dehalococcoidales bacterium]
MAKLWKFSGTRWLLVSGGLMLLLGALPAIPARAAAEVVLTLSSDEFEIGDDVSIKGTGFEAGSYVYLYLSSDAAATGSEIDGKVTHYQLLERNVRSGEESSASPGEFRTSFTVPEELTSGDSQWTVHGGDYHVYATYRGSQEIVAVATFNIPHGEIEIDPEAAVVGSQATITGQGLRPEQRITIRFDGQETAITGGDEITDADGEFTCTIAIPENPSGSYPVTAIDEAGNRPETEFTVEPQITLSPSSQDVDGLVEVKGTGFAAREDITLVLDGDPLPTIPVTMHTNRLGSLGGSFVVPPHPAYADGCLARVRVYDESDHFAEAEFYVLPIPSRVRLTPDTSLDSPGHAGMELTVAGIWFTANATITVTYDGDEALTVATAEATDSRTFSATFTVPPSAPGSHAVVAGDGANSVSVVFTMESEKPATPVLQEPAFSQAAEPETHFDWDEVTDPSGVSYSLQVAADDNFSAIVLNKEGLSDSEYTLSGEESLTLSKGGSSYYWRVKAVDGTLTESDWTTPRPFSVGASQETTLPGWLKYLGIGVGAAVAAFFIIRARRQAAE